MRVKQRNLWSILVLGMLLMLAAGCSADTSLDLSPLPIKINIGDNSGSTPEDTSQNGPESENLARKDDEIASSSSRVAHGKYTWPNNDKYEGEMENGLPHGSGSFYLWSVASESWLEAYTGEWKDGQMNGQGKMILGTDGSYYEGSFKNSLPSGKGTLYDPFSGISNPPPARWTTRQEKGEWISESDRGDYFFPFVPGE